MRILILIGVLLFCLPSFAKSETFNFGFVPQHPAKLLIQKWAPILRYLGKQTGHRFLVKTAPNISTFEKRLANGEYDLAYMNPLQYVNFSKNFGFTAWAKQKGKKIKGILVVRKDSTIRDIAGLSGKELAFPAPVAFGASILPRVHLSQQGIPISQLYVGSHDSVYRNVAIGRSPAGGGIQRTFSVINHQVRSRLRVLWVSKGYTPHAFAAHPQVPAKTVNALQKALVEMFDNPKGKKLLNKIGFKQGVETADNSDWDDVRKLKIDKLPE